MQTYNVAIINQLSAAKRRIRAQQVLGGKCAVCSEADPKVLQFDHKHNDGYWRRPENSGKSGTALAHWVIRNPEAAKDKLQLLCANCHARKHSTFNSIEGVYESIHPKKKCPTCGHSRLDRTTA